MDPSYSGDRALSGRTGFAETAMPWLAQGKLLQW